ncbi:hypothetical protein EV714DRAFT_278019 [Schizophyllum commune]
MTGVRSVFPHLRRPASSSANFDKFARTITAHSGGDEQTPRTNTISPLPLLAKQLLAPATASVSEATSLWSPLPIKYPSELQSYRLCPSRTPGNVLGAMRAMLPVKPSPLSFSEFPLVPHLYNVLHFCSMLFSSSDSLPFPTSYLSTAHIDRIPLPFFPIKKPSYAINGYAGSASARRQGKCSLATRWTAKAPLAVVLVEANRPPPATHTQDVI